jgi:hypothetical protein
MTRRSLYVGRVKDSNPRVDRDFRLRAGGACLTVKRTMISMATITSQRALGATVRPWEQFAPRSNDPAFGL